MSAPQDWFAIANVREKISATPKALTDALNLTSGRSEFVLARDVKVVSPKFLPPKVGLSKIEGQARLLHDLASIELQALELGMRTLQEFPDAPREFKEKLAEVTAGEARHLGLCLDGIEKLGYHWGHWDVHTALWNVVDHEDSLLDRILIVHRYLEGSGLDAGFNALTRLRGIRNTAAEPILEVINREEVDHVLFGSIWYRRICEMQKIDPSADFEKRIAWIFEVAPKREKVAVELRLKAGFTLKELEVIDRLTPKPFRAHHPVNEKPLASKKL